MLPSTSLPERLLPDPAIRGLANSAALPSDYGSRRAPLSFLATCACVMDGITEPVIVVLGHPIAGNPAQFALERAFQSMQIPWRVLSSDVPPERIPAALCGAEVLGFRALLLDQNLITDCADSADPQAPAAGCDFYWRSSSLEQTWHSENLLSKWLESQIRDHFAALESSKIGPLLWIGASDPNFPDQIADEQSQSPIAWASTEAIEHAKLIAVSETVDATEWPTSGDGTLVIDFAKTPNDLHQIRSLGYKAIGREQARVGILMECIERLTGKQAPADVLTEAVEEYLAI